MMEILGVSEQDEILAEELQERVDIVVHKLKFFPDKPSLTILSSLDSFVVHYNESLNEMVGKAGGTLVYASSWDNLVDMNPDILILSLEGETIESTLPKVSELLHTAGFSDLKAVKENKVFILSYDLLQSEKAKDKVDVLEAFAEIITPKYFNFGLEGSVWINFAL